MSERAQANLPGHTSDKTYQYHHVELKTLIVYKYAQEYVNLYENPGAVIHKILKGSTSPAKDLRQYIGDSAGSIPVSQRQVARYLCEYKFFDAAAHDQPTEVVGGEKVYGRAVFVTTGGKGGFHMDRRGQHDHRPNFIFHQTDLKIKAQMHMRKLGDGLSVDAMVEYFNDLCMVPAASASEAHEKDLLPPGEAITAAQLEDMGVTLPIKRTTAWRWVRESILYINELSHPLNLNSVLFSLLDARVGSSAWVAEKVLLHRPP